MVPFIAATRQFFVPALEVVIERFDISDDVAGATLMAAGGSAPELFTSLIGVFFAKSGSVGFGTIIGSAVFNVLFVIGMCAIFSLDVLELTWWPLARDCSWYTLDLVVLYLCFRDKQIELWESALLLALYLCYVAFMKFNTPAERFIKVGAPPLSHHPKRAAQRTAIVEAGVCKRR
jgi:sodium/potassium/calcium exchanger 2